MNTVVEVDPSGPVAGKLRVGDKILAVDGTLLNYKRFVDVVGSEANHKLRVARLAAAAGNASSSAQSKQQKMFSMSKKKDKERRKSAGSPGQPAAPAPVVDQQPKAPRPPGMPALREVKLFKDTEETKIGAVFHRSDDAFDKSFFNVEGSSVQPIIKKVDPGSMAETGGLVPGDVVLSVNGISGLSNFQVVEMLRKGQGVFNLVVISGRQVQQQLQAQR
jgi:C-terminal processing protease CtpA/Prc